MTNVAKRKKTDIQGDPLESAWAEFLPLAKQWRESVRAIGRFLAEKKESLGGALWTVLRERIRLHCKIPLSAQDVAMRIALGEIDERVAGFFAPSTLAHLPTDKLPQADTAYTFVSVETGAPATKTIDQMTAKERSGFIGPHGPRTIDKLSESPQTPIFSRAVATSIRREGRDMIALVNSQKIEVRIPGRLLDDAQ